MDRHFPIARVWVGCALLVALVGAAGCGGIKRIPTSGTVTLDGQPLTEGVLQFIPDSSKGTNYRVSCSGPISNGKWNLVTSGMGRADTGTGAPVGWFKVVYTLPNEGSKAPGASGTVAPKVADKYRSEETARSQSVDRPTSGRGYKIELTANSQTRTRSPTTGNDTGQTGCALKGVWYSTRTIRANTVRISCTGPVNNRRYNLATSEVMKNDTGSGANLRWYKVTLMNDLRGWLRSRSQQILKPRPPP